MNRIEQANLYMIGILVVLAIVFMVRVCAS
jgi:hypothetical protein